MKVIILNGPMGVGKTTVGNLIADRINGTAYIDGDWCMDLHPFVGNSETRAMAVDNILHMLGNYRDCSSCNMAVVSWLIDDDKVLEQLIQGIRDLDMETSVFTLVCSEEQLRKQWKEDKICPWRTEEWLSVSLRSLDDFRAKDNVIDTTCMETKEVTNLILKSL
ncbi:shikimate kinase [Oscillospiraceae bacterium]|nr:shikimate kinase [Oscillospiraceae bacterium]